MRVARMRTVRRMRLRTSSPELAGAFIDGVRRQGGNVVDYGLMGTDMMYYAVAADDLDGGAQITASHNPGEYNGCKMVRREAFPLSGDAGIKEMKEMILAGAIPAPPAERGTIEHLLVMPVRASEIAAAKIWANGLIILLAAAFSLHVVVHLGLGVPTIVRAFVDPGLPEAAFAAKLGFTLLTLGAGFLGGEVTPLFFIGATLGNVLGRLLGLPLGLSAGVGMAALFAVCSNTPLALSLMAVELLGAGALPHVLIVSALAYVLYAMTQLFKQFGAVELNIALTALVIGSALLMLSAFWHQARRAVVLRLPESIAAKLPLIDRQPAPAQAA